MQSSLAPMIDDYRRVDVLMNMQQPCFTPQSSCRGCVWVCVNA